MIIRGNTVGNIMPRTNFNQTDPGQNDFLIGRENLLNLIADAKKAGTDASILAGDVKTKAVMKQGTTMEGDIDMSNYYLKGLPTPINDGDAVPKNYMEQYVKEAFLGGKW